MSFYLKVFVETKAQFLITFKNFDSHWEDFLFIRDLIKISAISDKFKFYQTYVKTAETSSAFIYCVTVMEIGFPYFYFSDGLFVFVLCGTMPYLKWYSIIEHWNNLINHSASRAGAFNFQVHNLQCIGFMGIVFTNTIIYQWEEWFILIRSI